MSERVPEGWKLSKIAEISSILDSKRVPLNSQERAKRVGEYPYYGANGVQGYIDDFIFEGEHVLLAEDGGNFEQWATRPISYLVDGKFWVNNHAHILKAKKNHSTKFIHYSLVHKNILKHINGGTRAKLNQADMRDIQVLCPPFPEQQKIAKILTSVDEVIEKTQAQIDKLKDLKTGMMQELLTQGVGVDGKPHTEFKDSPVGRIPRIWDVSTLGVEFTLLTGSTPSRKESAYFSLNHATIPWVKTTDLNDGYISHTEENITPKAIAETSCKLHPKGSALVAMYGGWNQIGRSGLLACDAATNQALVALLVKKRVLGEFVNYWLIANRYRWKSIAASSRKDPNITKQDVADFLIAVPSIEEQRCLIAKFDSISKVISAKQNRLEAYKNTKKALMQDLLTGKVRVTID